jgi:fused signal recognition particle receptor
MRPNAFTCNLKPFREIDIRAAPSTEIMAAFASGGCGDPQHLLCLRQSRPQDMTSWARGLPICESPARSSTARPISRRFRYNVAAVFDFVRKAGEFVKERARKDIAEVTKFNEGLAKSRARLARDLSDVLAGVGSDFSVEALDAVLSEIEDVLITADMGVDVVDKVLIDLREAAKANKLEKATDIKTLLKESLVAILENATGGRSELQRSAPGALVLSETPPTIIMVIGANGMGKTTTIGKLAARLRRAGSSVLVVAGDTFRAGAVDQLAEWVMRAGADFVAPKSGAKSPSAVVYDGMEKADARNKSGSAPYDFIIIDTSGRLHTNTSLMGELQKMVRVVQKFRSDGPHEILLVVDASIGRNAVAQAETWQREVGVTGLAVTKLDGTARAGFVVSVVDELHIPVKFIGVGETLDDLRDFDAELFVDGLVGQ